MIAYRFSFILFILLIILFLFYFEIETATKVPNIVICRIQCRRKLPGATFLQLIPQNSFGKEKAPFLSIPALPVVENQLENCVRIQPHSEYVLLDSLCAAFQTFIKNDRKKRKKASPSFLRKH